MAPRPLLLTVIAVMCFAANSLLCRMALGPGLIDPATFTTTRVLSAAALLSMVVLLRSGHFPRLKYAKPGSIAALLGYLVFFSFAYTRLSAGTGALILFGAVQLTMFARALREGEAFSITSWAGLALAVAGLIYLVLPGVNAPDPLGSMLMAASGVCWGLFSLLARGVDQPTEANASNFLCCLLPALLINLATLGDFRVTPPGLLLAVVSGSIASGAGYTIWYMALRTLPATRAATVQLSVPAIAAIGGTLFLSETLTLRILAASAALLGGIAVVLTQRVPKARGT